MICLFWLSFFADLLLELGLGGVSLGWCRDLTKRQRCLVWTLTLLPLHRWRWCCATFWIIVIVEWVILGKKYVSSWNFFLQNLDIELTSTGACAARHLDHNCSTESDYIRNYMLHIKWISRIFKKYNTFFVNMEIWYFSLSQNKSLILQHFKPCINAICVLRHFRFHNWFLAIFTKGQYLCKTN